MIEDRLYLPLVSLSHHQIQISTRPTPKTDISTATFTDFVKWDEGEM